MRQFILLFLTCLPLSATTTYYVDKGGSDSNPGTQTSAFLSVQRGVDAALPGDSVVVGAGNYPERVKSTRAGFTDRRITIDGRSVAVIMGFSFKHAHLTLQNITLTGTTQNYLSLANFGPGAHFCRLSGCLLDVALAPKVYGIQWSAGPLKPFDDITASDCVIENNTIKGIHGITLVSLMGDRNIVRSNKLLDSTTADFFRVWGRGNLIQGNLCQNNYLTPGLGNHPDFIQTFGNLGHGSQSHIIDGNIVRDIQGGQITQLEGNLVPEIGDWTFRNNTFMNVALGASCTIPGIKYYNNVFYKCNTGNGGPALTFGKRSYGGPNDTAQGYGGAIGINYAHRAHVFNNVFLGCGDQTSLQKGWYAFSTVLEDVAADYNYVGKEDFRAMRVDELHRAVGDAGGWDYQKWWEPHGINGGDPGFVAPDDFHLTPASPLIGKANPFNDLFTTDHDGVTRGLTWDIGAYEAAAIIEPPEYVDPPPPLQLPLMTREQRDTIVAKDGMLIYQTDATPGLRVYENGAWVRYSATADP